MKINKINFIFIILIITGLVRQFFYKEINDDFGNAISSFSFNLYSPIYTFYLVIFISIVLPIIVLFIIFYDIYKEEMTVQEFINSVFLRHIFFCFITVCSLYLTDIISDYYRIEQNEALRNKQREYSDIGKFDGFTDLDKRELKNFQPNGNETSENSFDPINQVKDLNGENSHLNPENKTNSNTSDLLKYSKINGTSLNDELLKNSGIGKDDENKDFDFMSRNPKDKRNVKNKQVNTNDNGNKRLEISNDSGNTQSKNEKDNLNNKGNKRLEISNDNENIKNNQENSIDNTFYDILFNQDDKDNSNASIDKNRFYSSNSRRSEWHKYLFHLILTPALFIDAVYSIEIQKIYHREQKCFLHKTQNNLNFIRRKRFSGKIYFFLNF